MNTLRPLVWALTGEALHGADARDPDELSDVDDIDPDELSDLEAALAAAGWPRERLQRLRAQRLADELTWPFPVPAELLGDLGRAQFQALLQQAIADLGLRTTARPSRRTRLDAAEQRLQADRPPHW